MSTNEYALVLQRVFEKTGLAPRGSVSQRSARCPAHPDTRSSLSIGLGREGGVVLRCFAGCDTADVLAALDLTFPDLHSPESRVQTRRDPNDWVPCQPEKGHSKVAEYLYHDEDGNVLFGVTRCDSKCFAQWRPDRSKKYGRRWSLRDDDGNKVRQVPFRLPQLIEAVRNEQVIWVVEGEKDALALVARPMIAATCNQGGAGMGWPEDFHQFFVGADVNVVADRDEQGQTHARKIVANLMPVARSIHVLQARFGKDASDHFAAGGHTGDFHLAGTPKAFPSEDAR